MDGDAENVALERGDSFEGPTFFDESTKGGVDCRALIKRLSSERTRKISRLIIEYVLQRPAGQIVLVERENGLLALV